MNERFVIGIREPGSLALLQSLLQQGIIVRIRVSGNSMLPLLKGGEIVEIEPLPNSTPWLGDILFLCDQQGSPLVHRLIWKRLQHGMLYFLTKGDACTGFDGFTPMNNIFGRVRRIIPDTGPVIHLNTFPLRRQAYSIVSCTLIGHALHRISGKRKKRLLYTK